MPTSINYPFQNIELSLAERVTDLITRFTLDEKIALMMQYQPGIERLGVPPYKQGTEAAHGVAWLGEATVFPQNIGLSNTWNPELMKKIGEAIGDEARVFFQKDPAQNGLTLWAPTVDMERDPRWGRTEEAYGEDPELTGQLTKELVKGMQGDHPFYLKTVATLKHFLGNNNEVDRGECSASIDPRNMHEYYLKAFEQAFVDGKAKSMMTAYNSINGTPALLHPYVNEIVKGDWGMDGFIVSDAGDVVGIVNDHKYYDNYAEALADTIKSGIDSITDDAEISMKAIREALDKGLLTEDDLNMALSNTFSVRFRLGEFDAEENPYSAISEDKLLSTEHEQLSYKAAQEQMVLLKNDGLLPLNKERIRSVTLLGPLANEVHADWYSGTPSYRVTPLEGIARKIGSSKLTLNTGSHFIRLRSIHTGQYIGVEKSNKTLIANVSVVEEAEVFEWTDWGFGSQTLKSASTDCFVTAGDEGITATAKEASGWFVKEIFSLDQNEEGNYTLKSWDGKAVNADQHKPLAVQRDEGLHGADIYEIELVKNGLTEAVQAAANSDIAVVFVGNSPFINGKECIDREDIILPPAQEELVRAVKEVNQHTVVVIVSSYPYAVNWLDDHIPSMIYSSHAGPELGNAIADVLFGDYNPAGRLSMTWYRDVKQLPTIMDYDIIKGKRTYQYFDGDVLYPFGHGLSYTDFRYSGLTLDESYVTATGEITLTVTVSNCGNVAGDEVVQLYTKANQSRVVQPLKTMRDFRRIHLKAGESQVVEFVLPASKLAFWDVTQERYCVEKGIYSLMIGSSSSDIHAEVSLEVDGEEIPPRILTDVLAINYDDYLNVVLDEGENRGYCIKTTGKYGWIAFHDVDLNNVHSLLVVVSTLSKKADIEIRVGAPDGDLIGTLSLTEEAYFEQHSTELDCSTDSQSVYLILRGTLKLQKISLY